MASENPRLDIVELSPQDFDRAADLLAAAFYDNPLHVYIFSDPSVRFKAIRWLLRGNLNLNLDSKRCIGQSFALVEPNTPPGLRQIKAMAFWNPPQSDSVSFLSMVKGGLLSMPFRFGWESFQRLFEVLNEISDAKKEALDSTPAWYLNNMVVAPELRGKGVGTKILSEQLQQVVDPSGFATVLMTQKETNVRFYQRLGFEVVKQSKIGKGKNAFTNWCMLRPSVS